MISCLDDALFVVPDPFPSLRNQTLSLTSLPLFTAKSDDFADAADYEYSGRAHLRF